MMEKMGFERATEQEQARLGALLWDVHAAGMKIVEFTGGREYEEFAGSEVLQSVVASMLGIIASSLRDVKAQFPGEAAKLSNVGRLVEGEAGGAPEKVWRVVEEVIPGLVAESRGLLEEWHQA